MAVVRATPSTLPPASLDAHASCGRYTFFFIRVQVATRLLAVTSL